MKPGVSFDSRTGTWSHVEAEATSILRGWPHVASLRIERDQAPAYYYPEVRIPRGDLAGRIEALERPGTRRGQVVFPFMISRRERQRIRAELAWLRWCQLIPTGVREVVTSFHRDHWSILSFLASSGSSGLDLAKANPALFFALVHGSRLRPPGSGTNLKTALAQLLPGRKQREILAWLGFPGTEAARRLLARVAPGALSLAFLRRLRLALRDPAAAASLARLSRVNVGALRLVADPELRGGVSQRLLAEVACAPSEDRRGGTAILLRRTRDLARRLLPDAERVRPPGSMAEIRETHKGLAAYGERFGLHRLAIEFPRPPVPGIETIVPITTARGLLEESWAQRHCAASYVERIAFEQDVYFYRVLAPQRCTLMLEWDRGFWIAKELRRACNAVPSAASIAAVREWLVRLTGLPPNWTLAREMRSLAV